MKNRGTLATLVGILVYLGVMLLGVCVQAFHPFRLP